MAPRNVFTAGAPSATGGHGSNALSRPMRVEEPAVRITPQMPAACAIARRYQSRGVLRASEPAAETLSEVAATTESKGPRRCSNFWSLLMRSDFDLFGCFFYRILCCFERTTSGGVVVSLTGDIGKCVPPHRNH